jgi:hypothetical protein
MGPFVAWLIVLALLVPLAFLTDGDEEPAAPEMAPVQTIARRVEALRDLRFLKLPQPLHVSPQQAREEALEDFDAQYPPQRRRRDEILYASLGLLPEDVNMRELASDLFGEGVAGYYDPRNGRLRIVDGAATGTRVAGEMVIAHELTHALEDQRFDFDTDDLAEGDDGALAYSALVEGTATVLMYDYVDRHFTQEEAIGGLLSTAFAPTGDLPPFMMAQLLFSYVQGERFVRNLQRANGWALVDAAFLRPPASTEQVMHPRKYLRFEDPVDVPLRGRDGTFGEWATWQLLDLAGGTDADEAAAGWGGDAFSVSDDAVKLRWVWDTPRDRAEFITKLRAYTRATKRGKVTLDGDSVTLTVPARR